ncbi:hypothetical protein AB6A40_008890 [Gnathostoma spinigerum]|uniref:Uncharacterized protein n=1 Tax=Gnathostoma spinigerum TaxID=75299 RepID=A0ABD6EXH5_9BILA
MSNFDSASFLDEAKTTGSETSHPAVSVLAKFCLPSTLRQCIQVLYMDATNTLLIRDVDGNVVLLDGCLENAHPLLNAQLKTDANLFYDRQNGTIVAIDDTKLCMRRDYAGTFLLKTILSPANDGQVSVELPVEEVCSSL